MEELFNELISIVTDRLSDLTDTINIDGIMQSATDAIQSTVEALSNADIDLDEDTKATLISRIIDSFDGGDTSTILDNLHFITENPLDGIGETSDIASQGMDFSSVADTGTVLCRMGRKYHLDLLVVGTNVLLRPKIIASA